MLNSDRTARLKNGDPYLLPRSPEEALNLDRQHQMLVSATKLLVHPSLSAKFSRFRHILDCGTGTTAWARHVIAGGVQDGQRTQLDPRCIVEACDFSAAHLPVPLPKGLHDFFIQDVLKPFAEEKQGRYDLIHQRFLSGGIPEDRWPQALKNLKDGLRPGGFLNLHEAGFPYVDYGPENVLDGSFCLQYYEMSVELCNIAGVHWSLHEALPRMLEAAGFVDIQVLSYLLPFGAAGADLGPAYVSLSLETAPITLAFTGPFPGAVQVYEGTPEGHDLPSSEMAVGIVQGMMKELKKYGVGLPCVMVVARKPF